MSIGLQAFPQLQPAQLPGSLTPYFVFRFGSNGPLLRRPYGRNVRSRSRFSLLAITSRLTLQSLQPDYSERTFSSRVVQSHFPLVPMLHIQLRVVPSLASRLPFYLSLPLFNLSISSPTISSFQVTTLPICLIISPV
jgi:hypothetical protein